MITPQKQELHKVIHPITLYVVVVWRVSLAENDHQVFTACNATVLTVSRLSSALLYGEAGSCFQ